MPQFTSGLEKETVARLISEVPNIIGIKDSSGSLDILMDRSTFRLGFTVLTVCIGAPSGLIVASILRLGLRTTFVIGSTLIFAGSVWMSQLATKPWQYLVGPEC